MCLFQQTPAEERPQSVVLDQAPPSTQDWASYASPELARQIFRTTTDPCCLNTGSMTKQARPQTSPMHFT